MFAKGKIDEVKRINQTLWDKEQEKWYISIVEVVEILTDSERPRKYCSDLKKKLKDEECYGTF